MALTIGRKMAIEFSMMWRLTRLREIGQPSLPDLLGILNISLFDRLRAWSGTAVLGLVMVFCISHDSHAGPSNERKIWLYNIHTKETVEIVYKRDGKYVPEALEKLNHFMRDWRRNVSTKMDPQLFDIISDIHEELGSKKPVHLISGHRSEKTNSNLRKTRGGQAKKSKHITGQAADIHFPDVSVKQLRNSALVRERGGVGYYPTSAIPFVHVDTGRVRHWPRLPRQELAILFPEGGSKHVPSDGKTLTRKDFQVALANLQKKGGELPIAVQRRLDPVVVASLSGAPAEVPIPTPREQKPRLVLASLTPSFGSSKPELENSSVENRTQLTAARADSDDFLNNGPSQTVDEDQISSAPDYDDDHPDELYYQPFPVLPLMTETPMASVDLSDPDAELSLPKVHLMFAEARDMLHMQFEPGLQFAELFWAQKFQGSAVKTDLKRVARDTTADEPVRTARK